MQRQTIIHYVGDEPITVKQADGSQITVPAGDKGPADLPNEIDFLLQPMIPDGTGRDAFTDQWLW